jgi:plasmid stabilization system protein ParE
MAFKVLTTDNALNDLREIVEFIAEDDPRAAERLGEKLIVRAMDLANLPERHALHGAWRWPAFLH